jgi:hypothetical protein
METLENDVFIEKVHPNGLVELLLKDGQVFDVPHMVQAKKFSTSLIKDRKIALLVSFEGAFYPTREARELLADPGYSSHQGAIAVITKDLGIRLLANLYLRINKPKVPLKVFEKKADALNWLSKYFTSPTPLA